MKSTGAEGADLARAEEIAVLVVNWNSWRLSLQCLHSLRRSQGVRWRLYLVDNASTDGSPERLSDLGEDVVLIRSPVNGGWSGGNNLGVSQILHAGYQYIFILNNDAEVLEDTLAQLKRVFLEFTDTMPVLGPLHLDSIGEGFNFVGAELDQKSGLPKLSSPTKFARAQHPPTFETAYIRGAGLFAHRTHFETIGLFDDDFYLNYDETDWCYRACAAGFPLLMVRDALIRHMVSATIGGDASPLNTYFLVRNGLLFAEKHLRFRQRLGMSRDYYRWARSLARADARHPWQWRMLTSKSALLVAFRAALRDYMLRRFGECPPAIRQLNKAADAVAV